MAFPHTTASGTFLMHLLEFGVKKIPVIGLKFSFLVF